MRLLDQFESLTRVLVSKVGKKNSAGVYCTTTPDRKEQLRMESLHRSR